MDLRPIVEALLRVSPWLRKVEAGAGDQKRGVRDH